jgi:putative nucleotidyltransferase with HDIG domain
LSELDDLINQADAVPNQNHSRRVAAFAIAIARKMGLTKEEIKAIARGAYLHDIGKLTIRSVILLKPAKLTVDEMAIVREHSYKGYKITSRTGFLVESSGIVYAHHERYDGTGYPRGLRGIEIPIGARIVAIANTLDVITSDQPYRSAQTFEAAREEIKLWAGRQFDPQIVDLFLEIPASLWQGLRNAIPPFSELDTG